MVRAKHWKGFTEDVALTTISETAKYGSIIPLGHVAKDNGAVVMGAEKRNMGIKLKGECATTATGNGTLTVTLYQSKEVSASTERLTTVVYTSRAYTAAEINAGEFLSAQIPDLSYGNYQVAVSGTAFTAGKVRFSIEG